MDGRTPQGSPLSPVLWLIYNANTLKRVDERCESITLGPRRTSGRHTHRAIPRISVCLISYVDDVNPLIVTEICSRREHRRIVEEVNTILEEEAAQDELRWDRAKESRIEFGGRRNYTATLGTAIDSGLEIQPHVKTHSEGQTATRGHAKTGQLKWWNIPQGYEACAQALFVLSSHWGQNCGTGPTPARISRKWKESITRP